MSCLSGGLLRITLERFVTLTGIFISVDPLVAKTGQAYLYEAGNPTTFSDPNGLEPCSWCSSSQTAIRGEMDRAWNRRWGTRVGLVADPDKERYRQLQALMRSDRNIALFERSGNGYRVAELIGDAGASNVVVSVPGAGTNLGNFTENAAGLASKLGAGPAVYPYLYDAPGSVPSAMNGNAADQAMAGLASFVDGLAASSGDPVSIVAHSYGTVVAGRMLRDGLASGSVDTFVAAGSPGWLRGGKMPWNWDEGGFSDYANSYQGSTHLVQGENDDFVTGQPWYLPAWHGEPPPGASRHTVPGGHSDYFRGEGLSTIAGLVNGAA